MYKVMMLPLAENDIEDNTDYIAYEKKEPETALKLAMGLIQLLNLNLCLNSMSLMKMKN